MPQCSLEGEYGYGDLMTVTDTKQSLAYMPCHAKQSLAVPMGRERK